MIQNMKNPLAAGLLPPLTEREEFNRMVDIGILCHRAGRPDLTDQYTMARLSVEQVREKLADLLR